MNFIKLPKKWSGQNWTSWTGSYAYAHVAALIMQVHDFFSLDRLSGLACTKSTQSVHTQAILNDTMVASLTSC